MTKRKKPWCLCKQDPHGNLSIIQRRKDQSKTEAAAREWHKLYPNHCYVVRFDKSKPGKVPELCNPYKKKSQSSQENPLPSTKPIRGAYVLAKRANR